MMNEDPRVDQLIFNLQSQTLQLNSLTHQVDHLLKRIEKLEGFPLPQTPRKGQVVWVWDGNQRNPHTHAGVFGQLEGNDSMRTIHGLGWEHWEYIQPEEIQ